MSNEGLAFIVFSAGMLVLMGIGMNMALALVLTGVISTFWMQPLMAATYRVIQTVLTPLAMLVK